MSTANLCNALAGAALAFAALGDPAKAAPVATAWVVTTINAQQLLDICERDQDTCTSFIMGVVSAGQAAARRSIVDRPFCVATRAPQQVVNVVLAYLRAHSEPDERNLVAGFAVARALAGAFPCPAAR